jgi:5-aminolevulinate synthase
MPCPFLTRLSSSYVRNYGTTLLKTYGQHCPIMSRLASNVASTDAAMDGGKVLVTLKAIGTHLFSFYSLKF